jgi:RNA polymerase sigma-70 factor (ECF subfamily)
MIPMEATVLQLEEGIATEPVRDDDPMLVERARRGDGVAIRQIIKAHNQRLYRVARAVLRDDHEAEDVVQETYVRAFTHLDGFRSEARLSTWLTRIALNEALGRKRRLRPTIDFTDIDDFNRPSDTEILMIPTGHVTLGPEAALGRTEVRAMLEDAIEALPDPFRVVFILRDVEDMSAEEASTHLGVRPETIKTRLVRARRLLRAALERRIAPGLAELFPFDGARCNRLADVVLDRLGLDA